MTGVCRFRNFYASIRQPLSKRLGPHLSLDARQVDAMRLFTAGVRTATKREKGLLRRQRSGRVLRLACGADWRRTPRVYGMSSVEKKENTDIVWDRGFSVLAGCRKSSGSS